VSPSNVCSRKLSRQATFWLRRAPCLLLVVVFGSLAAQASTPVPSISIGLNFGGSTFGVDTAATPADANGAIGPRHYVEFINGSFAVYNKTNGAQVKRIADTKFWSNAGVTLATSDAVTDPRVMFDPTVQRWFASMVDFDANAPVDPTLEANDFLLAVSDTSDPTAGWHGFLFQADPDNGAFADFPTLGFDANAVYISGDMYQGEDNPLGASLVSIPKAELVAASPTIAHRTFHGVMDYALRGEVLQPATCIDGSSSGAILSVTDIGNDSDPHSNLVSFAVLNAGTPTATLTVSTFIPTLPWEVPDSAYLPAPSFAPIQPDNTDTLQANEARLSARVYAVNGVLYAVHNTMFNGHVAIRWYRVRASDHTLLESGTISDPDLDLFFPSVAANASGVVVISFNGCGLTSFISCYAMAGQTINDVTTFGNRILLMASATSYHDLYEELGLADTSRWGDYSATSVDPNDPNRFWCIQMYASDSDVWRTQITQMITVPVVTAPSLTINKSGSNVLVSWPVSPGYHLTSATNVTGTVTWTNVIQTSVTNNNQVTVTLPASAQRQFFRLQNP
jgi:hypothetical protein